MGYSIEIEVPYSDDNFDNSLVIYQSLEFSQYLSYFGDLSSEVSAVESSAGIRQNFLTEKGRMLSVNRKNRLFVIVVMNCV